jgi:hypothetical protein
MIKLSGFINMTPPSQMKEGMYDENEDNGMGAEEERKNIKAKLMSIHSMAKEAYNVLDEQDDPEDWVLEQVEEVTKMMNAIHSHLTYMKKKASELDDDIDVPRQQGW